MKILDTCRQITDTESGRVLLYRDEVEAVLTAGDTISRRQAIDICANTIDLWRGQLGEGALIAVRDKIKELPSAQPERIKGHWVNGRCDKCNEHAPFWCMASTYYASNFCPNCGADMRGEA